MHFAIFTSSLGSSWEFPANVASHLFTLPPPTSSYFLALKEQDAVCLTPWRAVLSFCMMLEVLQPNISLPWAGVILPTICNMLTVMSRIVNITKERPSRIYSHELTPLKPCSKFHLFPQYFCFPHSLLLFVLTSTFHISQVAPKRIEVESLTVI